MSPVTLKHFSHSYNFLKHYVSAGNEHDVHSPFVFRLLTEAIYNRKNDVVFEKIELIRKELLHDKSEIEVIDLGAGSSFDGVMQKRSISDIAFKFAKPSRFCRMLFRVTEFLKPAVMVELGTSLGVSAMYQSAGYANGTLYTLEGCPQTAEKARLNFSQNGFENINCKTGNFDDTLPELLNNIIKVDYVFIDGNHTYEATMRYFKLIKNHIHENSVIIFDDINWSEGMKKAWLEIKSDPAVSVTLDFFMIGMVFFNGGFTKQDFLLRW